MVQAMLKHPDLSERSVVSDIEGDLPSPSYTIQTLKALSQSLGSGGAILIGGDQLENFHRWYRASDILAKFSLIVVGRENVKFKNTLSKLESELRLSFVVNDPDSVAKTSFGTQIVFLDQVSDASSSEIRKSIEHRDGRLDPLVLSRGTI